MKKDWTERTTVAGRGTVAYGVETHQVSNPKPVFGRRYSTRFTVFLRDARGDIVPPWKAGRPVTRTDALDWIHSQMASVGIRPGTIFQTRGVCCGVYIAGDYKRGVTHVVEVSAADPDGPPLRVLCRRVQLANIQPDGCDTATYDLPATCTTCQQRDPRECAPALDSNC